MKKKALIVFGTRPEAIKMAPLIQEFQKQETAFETRVCVTAQHREMLDQVLKFFDITPDYDLNLMKPGQNLYTITADVITGMKDILLDFKPDIVFVHGDTTTSFAAALAAYYSNCRIAHIEAGLRTYNKYSPFPEEINRQLSSRLADYHFAPTDFAKNNLKSEGVAESSIFVTGNTVIDALLYAQAHVEEIDNNPDINHLKSIIDPDKKILLVTGHRRENFGDGFLNICKALKELGADHKEMQIIYPVHLNPNVQTPVYEILKNEDNIHLINPISYPAFVWLMNRSHIILTDSGGVQEEAPSLGKPVLVMRDTTERQEAVEAGTVVLVGTNSAKIVSEVTKLMNNSSYYQELSTKKNPYGDGLASNRIVKFLMES